MKRITYLATVSQLLSQNNTSMRFKLPILVVLLSGFSLSLSAQTVVDFTTMTDANTYGTYSQKDMGGGVFAMWGGDTNNDGKVVYNGADSDRINLLNNVLLETGNAGVFSTTYVYSLYDGNDIDLNGNIGYNGTDPGRIWLLNQILLYPGNAGVFSTTLPILEQLP